MDDAYKINSFHFDPWSGEVGICSEDSCSYGGDSNHYTSELGAELAFKRSKKETKIPKPDTGWASQVPSFSRKLSAATSASSRQVTNSYFPAGTQQVAVTLSTILAAGAKEVYAHPQGKVAFVDSFGALHIMKHGKAANSSSTIEDLRSGRGRWQLVDLASEVRL